MATARLFLSKILLRALPSVLNTSGLNIDKGKIVAVILVSSFILLIQFYENFIVIPRNSSHIGFSVPPFRGCFVIIEQQTDHLFRPILPPFDIKIDFSTHLMF